MSFWFHSRELKLPDAGLLDKGGVAEHEYAAFAYLLIPSANTYWSPVPGVPVAGRGPGDTEWK